MVVVYDLKMSFYSLLVVSILLRIPSVELQVAVPRFSPDVESSSVSEDRSVSVCVVVSLCSRCSSAEYEYSLSTQGLSAREGADFGAFQSPLQIGTISLQSTSQTRCFAISIVNDAIIEDSETFNVVLRSYGVIVDTLTIFIIDNDNVIVSMRYNSLTRTEGDTISVCAELTSPTGGVPMPVTVTFTRNGQSPVTRTFSVGGVRVQCLNISNEDDHIFEGATTFTVSLSSSQDRVTASGTTTVTIMDDDDVTVSMRHSALTPTEGDVISVCAELTSPTGGLAIPVIVTFTQSGRSSSVTRTFNPGGTRLPCLSPSNEDDQVFEDATTFTVSLSSSQDRVTASGTTTVTIMDDDDPLIGFIESSYTVQEGRNDSVIVCVKLQAPIGGLSRAFTVTLSAIAGNAESGVDYRADVYTVTRTFSRSATVENLYGKRCLNLALVDDDKGESSEGFTVSVASSEQRVRINESFATARVTILDNDDITVGMEQSSITQSESDGDVMVCAVLRGPAGGLEGRDAVIQLTTSMSGQQSGEMRTFPSGSQIGDTQCITLTVTDDDRFEDDETFTVTLSPGPSQTMVSATGMTTVTIRDDDHPVVGFVQSSYTVREGRDDSVSVCTQLLGPSGGLAREFTVTLTAYAGTALPGSDYNAAVAVRTFATFITARSMYYRCLTINIVDDSMGENNEAFTVSVSSANPRVMIDSRLAVATVVIVDDDIVPNLIPENFQVIATGSRSLSFSWSAPNNPSQTIVGYNVTCTSTSSGQTVFARSYTQPRMDEVTTFVPYTNYTCRVFVRVNGNAGEGATRTVRTHEEAPGSPPRNLIVQDVTSSSISLSWEPPLLSYGVITHYNLYINYTNGSDIERREATTATYTITHLLPYQIVRVEISAENSAGESVHRATVTTRTRESNPGLVSNVQFSALNGTAMIVSWMPPTSPNGEVLYYIIRLHSLVNRDSPIEINTTMLSTQWTQLEPYIPYNVSVLAVNSAGEGEPYSNYTFTEEGAPLVSPMNVSLVRLDEGSTIRVSWHPLALIEARGWVTSYAVYYWLEGTEIDIAMILNVPGTVNTTLINGVDRNKAYSVRLAASTIGGVGRLSNVYVVMKFMATDTAEGGSSNGSVLAVVIGGIVFTLFNALMIVACVVVFGYWRKRHKTPSNQNKEDVMASRQYEIPLPTRRTDDIVSTTKCVAYAVPAVIAGKPNDGENKYEMVDYSSADPEYEIIT